MTRTLRILTTFSLVLLLGLPSIAQGDDKDLYRDGSVYRVTMVRTEANSMDDYLEQLSRMYMPMMKAAQEAGLIKSYKLLTGGYSNMDDFDLMLLVEIENMAALDETPEREAKWKAVREKVRASLGQGAEDEIQATYRKIRSIQGSKLMREQILR